MNRLITHFEPDCLTDQHF